ncbi:MAG: hypothetical protein KDA84_22440, partial [Planctomycetaceae bacterium]|nr:hypothetical protein [Planctomycetaceae bacterium]
MLRHSVVILLCASTALAEDTKIDFDRDIRPIISDKCAHCHGPDPNARQADLRLDTRDGLFQVVVPAQPEQSELIARINSADPEEVMPPADAKLSLSNDQIELLTAWVRSGASWKGHWAFPRGDR